MKKTPVIDRPIEGTCECTAELEFTIADIVLEKQDDRMGFRYIYHVDCPVCGTELLVDEDDLEPGEVYYIQNDLKNKKGL